MKDKFTEYLQQNPNACLESQQNFERQKKIINEKLKSIIYIYLSQNVYVKSDVLRKNYKDQLNILEFGMWADM